MQRIVYHLVAATVTFTVAFSLLTLIRSDVDVEHDFETHSLSFTRDRHAEVVDHLAFSPIDEGWYGTHYQYSTGGVFPQRRVGLTYTASDGTLIPVTQCDYCSPVQAEAAWTSQFVKEVKILDVQPIFDENGTRTGKRAVITINPNGDTRPARIITLNGSTMRTITGPSLHHVYEFENAVEDVRLPGY